MSLPDKTVIKCNVSRQSGYIAAGASAYVQYVTSIDQTDRAYVLARSKSGRWVSTWISRKNLVNFRLKKLPADNPLYYDLRLGEATQEDFERLWKEF